MAAPRLTPLGLAKFDRAYRRRERIRASRSDTMNGYAEAIRDIEREHRFSTGLIVNNPVRLRRVS